MYVISNRGGNGLSYLHGKNGEESTAVKFRGSLMTELRDAAPGETPRIMVVVHGFNNGWEDTLQFFEKLDTNLAPRVQGGLAAVLSGVDRGLIPLRLPVGSGARAIAAKAVRKSLSGAT